MSTKEKQKSSKAPASITAYKGFDSDWKCRGFQYEVGKTYEHIGEIKACQSGFHACEHPLDVFAYYPPAGSRFALVEQSGITDKGQDGDSKIASQLISIKAEIDVAYLVKAAIEFTKSKCLPIDQSSPALATGNLGAALATAFQGAASATASQGSALATGTQGAAVATASQGSALATAFLGAAVATAAQGSALATAFQGAALATAFRGSALAAGTQGSALAAGTQGSAVATAFQGAASATGNLGAASATGYQGVACGLGRGSKSLAAKTGAIVLVHRDDDGHIIHIRASKVGENGIKPDTWYTLDKDGQFVECEA